MPPIQFEPLEAQEIVRALQAIAAADGAVVDREEQLLDGFGTDHGVGAHAHFASPLDEVALARAVTDPGKRREVVALCLKMAHADRDYAARERVLVERIARAFSIGDEELEALTAAARIQK